MTKNSKIPDNYQTVMPYLIVKDAEKFIEFMQNVFDATVTAKMMRDENIIMHGEIAVDGSTIMFADSTDQYTPQTAGMFIYVDNADERFQKAVDAGASVLMNLSDQSYGRTSGVTDPFGNVWWITSVK